MMVKSGQVFFYFEILLAPSELPANIPGQFSLSRQLLLHWEAATLKGLVELKKYIYIYHFSSSYLTKKCWFQDQRF